MPLCDCKWKCGLEVKPGNRFIHGHNFRGVKQSSEHIEKLRLANTGKKHTVESIEKIRRAQLGKPSNKKGKTFEEMYGEEKTNILKNNLSFIQTGQKRSEEVKANMKIAHNRPEVVEKHRQANTISTNRPKAIEKNRAKAIRQLEDPNSKFRPPTKTFNTSIEKIMKAIFEKLNVQYIFQKHISTKLVDFYIPHKNLIIECDGTYWHGRPEQEKIDRERDDLFRSLGYKIKRLSEARINELKIIHGVNY